MYAGIEWSTGIEDAWSKVATFVPKLLGCLAIIIITAIVARILSKITRRLAERIGLDRILERSGLEDFVARTTSSAAIMLGKLVKGVVWLIGLQAAFAVFGPDNAVTKALNGIVNLLPRIVVAGVILVVVGMVANYVGEVIAGMSDEMPNKTLIRRGAMVAIWVVGAFAALSQLQVAPYIVNGLFYALLAMVVGSTIVAVGGAGVAPLRKYWDRFLSRLDSGSN